MLRPQLFLTVWLVVGCLCCHVATSVEENPSIECGEDYYLSLDDQKCYPCKEVTCEAGYEPNLSCGSSKNCTKCEDGHFSRAGGNCQPCSFCPNTVNDIPCTPESDIICGSSCKKGYVMLASKCFRCNKVPYPSQHEECKNIETQSEDVEDVEDAEETPLMYTAIDSSKETEMEVEERLDPSWNSLLVVIILVGLILLVGLVIILSIVIFCNYKRHGRCGFARGMSRGVRNHLHNDGSVEQGDAGQDDIPSERVANNEICDETASLTQDVCVNDIQPVPRTSDGNIPEHRNGSLVREHQQRTSSDPSQEGEPVSVEHDVLLTSVESDSCNLDCQPRCESQVTKDGSPQSLKVPERNFYQQASTSSQQCPTCLSTKPADVSIGTAGTVNFFNCSGHAGLQCAHPSPQADLQANTTYNPCFNPS